MWSASENEQVDDEESREDDKGANHKRQRGFSHNPPLYVTTMTTASRLMMTMPSDTGDVQDWVLSICRSSFLRSRISSRSRPASSN